MGDRGVQEGVGGFLHPVVEGLAQFLQKGSQIGNGDEIVLLIGIEVEIVEHFLVARLLLPAGGEQLAARGGVVGVGENELVAIVEAFDVDVARGAHGAHGFVGGMIGLLEEEMIMQVGAFAVHEGQEGLALEPGLAQDAGQVADSGEEIEEGYHGVDCTAALEMGGAASDEEGGVAVFANVGDVQGPLQPVVGEGEDVGGVVEAGCGQGVEYGAEAVVHVAGTVFVGGGHFAQHWGVGEWAGRLAVIGIFGG